MKDLTIRDKIAIKVLNGILSSGDVNLSNLLDDEIPEVKSGLANTSYAIADVMLKEREKKEGE